MTTPRTSFKAALENEFIEGVPDTPSSIYFELSRRAVSKSGSIFASEQAFDRLATNGDLDAAILDAQETLAYRIGCRAAYLDFSIESDLELAQLASAVLGSGSRSEEDF
jgi:2-methylaconitate cis-trans-isomerase PrpF